jgi:mycothiol synthase
LNSTISVRPFGWESLSEWTDLYNTIFGTTGTESEFDESSMRQHISLPGLHTEEDCFIAQDSDNNAGLAILWPERPICRAVVEMGVVAGHPTPDVEKALVEATIERARQLPVSVVHSQVSSGDERKQQLFHDAGFESVRQYATMRWLKSDLPDLALPSGFAFDSFHAGRDEQRLTDIQNATFADSWGFSPNTVEQIKLRVAAKATTPDGILFVTKGSDVAGYNWTVRPAGPGSKLGRVAMTGVHPNYRGQGLSRAAVVAGMQWLVSQGVEVIELEMDTSNVHAAKVYESLGFEKTAEAVWYELRLDD